MADANDSSPVPDDAGTGQPRLQTNAPADTVVRRSAPAPTDRSSKRFRVFGLRRSLHWWQSALLGAASIAFVVFLWWFTTRGAADDRIIHPNKLSSPAETFDTLHSLWFDRELTRNTGASLRRVMLGFGLAALVGVPIGIICGCFYWVGSLFAPFTIFGRNVPIAALIPLTFAFFGIGEKQKVMFIFMASIAFIIADSANAAHAVNSRYLDTAVTLGASRWQTVRKVVVPLAMPSIFNSLRLLFGLAFGYIMLSETINSGNETGGLGFIINMSRRIGPREHILLILMIIPVVALVIDRILYAIQRSLFPSQYGGSGILHDAWRTVGYWMEDVKQLVFGRKSLDDAQRAALVKQQPPKAAGP